MTLCIHTVLKVCNTHTHTRTHTQTHTHARAHTHIQRVLCTPLRIGQNRMNDFTIQWVVCMPLRVGQNRMNNSTLLSAEVCGSLAVVYRGIPTKSSSRTLCVVYRSGPRLFSLGFGQQEFGEVR
jgi:hypothetical protein